MMNGNANDGVQVDEYFYSGVKSVRGGKKGKSNMKKGKHNVNLKWHI